MSGAIPEEGSPPPDLPVDIDNEPTHQDLPVSDNSMFSEFPQPRRMTYNNPNIQPSSSEGNGIDKRRAEKRQQLKRKKPRRPRRKRQSRLPDNFGKSFGDISTSLVKFHNSGGLRNSTDGAVAEQLQKIGSTMDSRLIASEERIQQQFEIIQNSLTEGHETLLHDFRLIAKALNDDFRIQCEANQQVLDSRNEHR